MPVQPDTVYNETQPWSSINTPTGVYKQTPDQIQKMQQATMTASMDMPAAALRVYAPTGMTAVRTPQPTIDDVLNQTAGQAPQMSIFDYSNSPAGMMASSQPSISLGS